MEIELLTSTLQFTQGNTTKYRNEYFPMLAFLSMGLHVSSVSVMYTEWKDVSSSTSLHTKASEDSHQSTSALTPLDKNQIPERLPPYSGINNDGGSCKSRQKPCEKEMQQLSAWILWSAEGCCRVSSRCYQTEEMTQPPVWEMCRRWWHPTCVWSETPPFDEKHTRRKPRDEKRHNCRRFVVFWSPSGEWFGVNE